MRYVDSASYFRATVLFRLVRQRIDRVEILLPIHESFTIDAEKWCVYAVPQFTIPWFMQSNRLALRRTLPLLLLQKNDQV
jgi:hypothetical protein